MVLAELLIARGICTSTMRSRSSIPKWRNCTIPCSCWEWKAPWSGSRRAIARKEPILLYGDYDVDGTTAVVLLKTAIEMLGGVVQFHVPHGCVRVTACSPLYWNQPMRMECGLSSPWIPACAPLQRHRPRERSAST